MDSLKFSIVLAILLLFLNSENIYGQDICTNYTVSPGTAISSSGAGTIYNTNVNVPDSYTISDVNVTVNITHTYNDDLDIYLISPTGTTVELSTDNGGSGDDYNNVTFDDASTNTLPNGTANLSGAYQPEGSLAGLNGQNSSGNWILRVIDDANGDGGTINSITLNLCYTPIPANCTNYTVTPGIAISSSGAGTIYNSIINVPDSNTITDVNVTVNISHTWNADLDIYLISPLGTTIELSTDNGGNGDNYNNVIFDDASANTLPTGSTTLSGTYSPEGSLASLNGENSNGNWTLRVIDDESGDGGTINSITLNLCYASSTVEGYLGPGGVGNTDGNSGLIIWYRPDNGVSITGSLVDSWTNSAGISAFNISETGTQRPTLATGAINGYDEISFNGSNRLRTGLTLNSTNFIVNQASTFIVTKADNTTQTSSIYLTDPLVGSTRFSNHIPWAGTVYYDIGTCCSADARIQVSGLTGLTAYSIWSYDAHPTTGKQLYRNQTLLQSRANTSAYSSHATQRFNLGGNTTGTNGFAGDVTELVIFKTKINTAQRIIVDNYLAAKYNQTLSINDIYVGDNTANGNFDHDVAGIGQASDGSNHTDSQGTGIVRISNPTALSNNEYLFWGEETQNPTYNFSTNTNNYTEQLNSRWRVSRQGNIGTVTVSFDISGINLSGKQNCSNLQLVVDNNYDFSSPENVYDLTISGSTATVTGVLFQNNRYFTLRYLDQIVWDGTNFSNGSGTGNAPDDTDSCLKLIVKSGSTANLTFNAHVREIEIETGGMLYVSNGILLEVDNQVVINGTIDLLGEAQLIQNHSGTTSNSGTGNLRIRQQGTSNLHNYNYWSAPVNRSGFWQIGYLEVANGVVNFTSGINANPLSTPITLSNRWLYKFQGPIGDYNSWTALSTTSNLLPGTGYTIKGSGAASSEQEFIFRGLPNDGDYAFAVNANTEFLTGNPYPSALDANQFITDNLSVIDGTLYFWESFASNNSHYLADYEGGYATYNLMMPLPAVADASGLTSGNGATSKPAPTQYVNIGQGFFTTITNTGTLNFNNGQRAFARESASETIFYKTTNSKNKQAVIEDERPKLWFSFTDPQGYGKIIGLGYDKNATYNYDKAYDAKSYDYLKNDLYWLLNNEKLVIQALPEINIEDKLPLEIKVSTTGLYKFSINKMENIPNDLNIYLVDDTQNIYYNLRNGEAQLLLNKNANQFSIVFQKENLLGIENIDSENIITSYDSNTKTLDVHFKEPLTNIINFKIYNTVGQEVLNISTPTSNQINMSHVTDGVYILKVHSKTDSLSSIKFVKY